MAGSDPDDQSKTNHPNQLTRIRLWLPVLFLFLSLWIIIVSYGLAMPKQRRALQDRIYAMNQLVIDEQYVELFTTFMHPGFQETFFALVTPEEFVASMSEEQKRALQQSFSFVSTSKPTFRNNGRSAYFHSSENAIFVSFVRVVEDEPWYFYIDSVRALGEPDSYRANGT